MTTPTDPDPPTCYPRGGRDSTDQGGEGCRPFADDNCPDGEFFGWPPTRANSPGPDCLPADCEGES